MKHLFSGIPKERNHIVILAALFLLAGVISAPYLSQGLWIWGLLAVSVILLLLCSLVGCKRGIAIAFFCFYLGVLRTQAALSPALPSQTGRCTINGTVFGEMTSRKNGRATFVLSDISLNGTAVSGKAYCTCHASEDILPDLFDGARLRFSGYVYLPSEKSGEPHFDFRMWMLRNGMSFGISIYDELVPLNDRNTARTADWTSRVRSFCRERLTSVLGDDSRIAMALLLGDRDGLSDEESRAFSDLGIAHIMSVSGLHIGMIGMLMAAFLNRLRISRKVQLPILAFILVVYCAVTGFSPSSLRAMIMLLLTLAAYILHRRADRMTILATSMIVILLVNPLQAFSSGFVLSFSAMLGIICLMLPIRKGLYRLLPRSMKSKRKGLTGAAADRVRRLPETIAELLSVSMAAQIGVLLPTAIYFHKLPVLGVLLNVLLIPFAGTILVPLYALLLPLSFIPGLGKLFGLLGSFFTNFLLDTVRFLSSLPNASIQVASPSFVVCIGIAFIVLLLSKQIPGKLRNRIVAALLTFGVLFGYSALTRPEEVRYIQLDAGQADSALLLDGQTTVLIDTGDGYGEALDYLLAERRDIDALYLTHLHHDHIGGVADLLENDILIRQVYIPAQAEAQNIDPSAEEIMSLLRERNIPVQEVGSGDFHTYRKCSVRVLWPDSEKVRTGLNPNEMCMALMIDLDGYKLFSAGDITSLYENYAAEPADLLKVAHHGSGGSTGEQFLKAVNPTYALVTCSSSSSAIPAPKTMERLASVCSKVFRTDETGDLFITVNGGQLKLKPYRGGSAE